MQAAAIAAPSRKWGIWVVKPELAPFSGDIWVCMLQQLRDGVDVGDQLKVLNLGPGGSRVRQQGISAASSGLNFFCLFMIKSHLPILGQRSHIY